MTLEPIASQVTLIHRSDNFRAHQKSVEQMLGSTVAVHTHCETEELHGEGGKLRAVTFRHNKTKETINFPVGHGTLIIMAGTMQQFWKHEVPKTKENVGERINLTFRQIVEPA